MTTDLRNSQRRTIRRLSPSVVNKIAAGEVIERPASVVKELLENAIDAGGLRIEVAISQGGLEEIRVTDDGCGIAHDELALAVASHATSKITDAEELFQVGTLGFRGEALASIAEVSQFELRSRPHGEELGYEIRVMGGVDQPAEPCGMPPGTTVVARHLFFNTPVRRKFLRTAATELGHVAEAFTRVALAFLDRQLTLVHNERVVYQLAPTHDWRTRIAEFFGNEIGDALIPIDRAHDRVRLHGFVVDPAVSRSNNRLQYLFLNGRYIRDRSLQHALSEAYRGLLMVGRYPICFLRLEMPSDMVDVNVHPAKLEVRFQDGGRLYSHLLSSIRDKFLTTDLTARARVDAGGDTSELGGVGRPAAPPVETGLANHPQLGFPTAAPRNWLDRPWQTGIGPGGGVSPPPATHPTDYSPAMMPPGGADPSVRSDRAGPSGDRLRDLAATADGPAATPATPSVSSNEGSGSPHRLLAMQVQDTYLVTETDEGLVVIDQHALHERILYEQLRERVECGGMECQRLLVPEPVQLPPAEAAVVLENRAVLAKVGIGVEPFGGDTILVTAYPAMLANHRPDELLRGLVDLLLTEGAQIRQRDLFDDLLHMIACKAAIKSGDRLTRDDIASLLEHRQLCRDAHHCPHGRPTALVFSREDLDRKFKRI